LLLYLLNVNEKSRGGKMAEKGDLKPGGLNRSSDEILGDIAAKRESISDAVGQLGERIQETLDWKVYVRRYPYTAIGTALGAGFLLAFALTKKRRMSPVERVTEVLAEKAAEFGEDLRKSARNMIVRTAAPSLFRGTIYGLAGKALMQYLQNRIIMAEDGSKVSEVEWERSQPHTSSPPTIISKQ
jgi:ElaB/YqjD/DUF883 family membrane-anchored ribosome-binding protein